MSNADTTVHSASISEVHNVPLSVIHRPLVPVLDEKKVESLMATIEVWLASFLFCPLQ